MSKDNSVPKLDLAPKLKRPLSLRNPLDYLRLLYWVFYFPQALRWYLDTFGGGYIPDTEMSARKGWQILGQNSVQRNLLLQGVILTVIIPPLLCQFLEQIGIEVDWFGVAGGVALGGRHAWQGAWQGAWHLAWQGAWQQFVLKIG
ncbi:hypothetical protein H1P_80021 [Hyella patelloides LEGE 07179]|uniref:Uncharacterized protein n=1 Tax=Hyella patelloides LEGE 07179 TaxID=945734 RepID=A0A563W476_9CYAN|nr:hypothetical protein [Hyella patelloides]VEP18466.1 hypothetical protein H1P_80021 [Hyella patelloides LEGE 07179]